MSWDDWRDKLDSVQAAWLGTLESIMGCQAEVRVGYEGEPLYFDWVIPRRTTQWFRISFDDHDHLSFSWMSCIPDGTCIDDQGEEMDEYPDFENPDDCYGIAFGRIPRVMADEMTRFRAYREKVLAEKEATDA